jgi:hypothetical protein
MADVEELMPTVSAETRLPGTGLWACIDIRDEHRLRSPGNLPSVACVCVP